MLPVFLINLMLIFVIIFFKQNLKLIPEVWQCFFEIIYYFILDIIKQQIGEKGIVYFPLIFAIFVFILLNNLFSLIPYGIALTSHIVIIMYLSITICTSIFIIGLLTHNLRFLQIFIPECPFILLPVLIPIELFSYVIRMFSLSIRLAANILAGHTLVHIIATFILNVAKIKLVLFPFMILPLFAILVLEFGVAFFASLRFCDIS